VRQPLPSLAPPVQQPSPPERQAIGGAGEQAAGTRPPSVLEVRDGAAVRGPFLPGGPPPAGAAGGAAGSAGTAATGGGNGASAARPDGNASPSPDGAAADQPGEVREGSAAVPAPPADGQPPGTSTSVGSSAPEAASAQPASRGAALAPWLLAAVVAGVAVAVVDRRRRS
jgi:hypothetical protein